jgi:hypothetical protein
MSAILVTGAVLPRDGERNWHHSRANHYTHELQKRQQQQQQQDIRECVR